MSSDIIEARKNLSALAGFTRGLLKLDDALQEAGDIDKLIAARKADLAGIETQIAAAEASLLEGHGKLLTMQSDITAAKDQVSQAAHDAVAVIEEARTNAADVVAKAEAAAADKTAAAEVAAGKVIAAAQAEADKIRAEALAAQDRRDQALRDATAAESRVAAANAELARLRHVFGSQGA